MMLPIFFNFAYLVFRAEPLSNRTTLYVSPNLPRTRSNKYSKQRTACAGALWRKLYEVLAVSELSCPGMRHGLVGMIAMIDEIFLPADERYVQL
jgi:hypothetical protein